MGFTEYIARQFSNPAGFGGMLSTFFMNHLNRLQYTSVISEVAPLADRTILDIGFGNGYLLKHLARYYENRYYGVDISSDMLTVAHKRNKRFIASGMMKLAKGSVDNLPFADNFFDLAYTVNTVYFWSDLEKGLAETYRVLMPGGAFVNVIYEKEWLDKIPYTRHGFSTYTIEELIESASKIGYAVETIEIKKHVSRKLCMRK